MSRISIGSSEKVNLVKSNMQKMYGRDLEVERQIDDVIEKSKGEGSRGGKVIGHTKSGKPIYSGGTKGTTDSHYKNHSKEDFDDSIAAHKEQRDIAIAEHEKVKKQFHPNSSKYKESANRIGYHNSKITHLIVLKQKHHNEGELEKAKDTELEEASLEKAEASSPLSEQDTSDRLEKGEVSDMFLYGYGNAKPFTFNKTGKEIKEKLPLVITGLQSSITQIQIAKKFLEEKIGVAPDGAYTLRGGSISYLQYNDDMTYPKDEYNSERAKYCREYNRLCYQEAGIQEDINTLGIIGSNLEDNKKYELSTSQLVALKFQ